MAERRMDRSVFGKCLSTNLNQQGRRTCRVKTYGDVFAEYEFHPESKCADADAEACGKQTVGLLQRRHIRVDAINYIGKESNLLEEVGQGLVHSEDAIYTVYPDPRRDEWQTKTLPALKEIPLNFLVDSCTGKMSRRALIDLRAGRSRPHKRNNELLADIVERLGNESTTRPRAERICITRIQKIRDVGSEDIDNSGMNNERIGGVLMPKAIRFFQRAPSTTTGPTDAETKNGWKMFVGLGIALGAILVWVSRD
jgi:hypothetical protein